MKKKYNLCLWAVKRNRIVVKPIEYEITFNGLRFIKVDGELSPKRRIEPFMETIKEFSESQRTRSFSA